MFGLRCIVILLCVTVPWLCDQPDPRFWVEVMIRSGLVLLASGKIVRVADFFSWVVNERKADKTQKDALKIIEAAIKQDKKKTNGDGNMLNDWGIKGFP